MVECTDCKVRLPRDVAWDQGWGQNRNKTWRCRECQNKLNEESAERFARAMAKIATD